MHDSECPRVTASLKQTDTPPRAETKDVHYDEMRGGQKWGSRRALSGTRGPFTAPIGGICLERCSSPRYSPPQHRWAWRTERPRIVFTRNAPTRSGLFLADADGKNERPSLPATSLDYNAWFSTDMSGNRVHEDGTRAMVSLPTRPVVTIYMSWLAMLVTRDCVAGSRRESQTQSRRLRIRRGSVPHPSRAVRACQICRSQTRRAKS